MKLSDYVVDYLAKNKIEKVFLMTGGAVAHLVDSFRNIKGIDYVCMQHEQAAAMAAESYSRVTKNMGAAMATSGPGATNLITGICCAWFDSIPAIYITGQVNTNEQKNNFHARQIGFQETDIVDIVKPITKFSAMVSKPEDIKYLLGKAFYLAKSGRPGPVLLDIPMNIQRSEIDPAKLTDFVPQGSSDEKEDSDSDNNDVLANKLKDVFRLISEARRPVIIAGGGIKIADAKKEFLEFIKKIGLPVITSWSGFDLIRFSHPLLVGQYGVYGNRGANFAVQNADLIISIGSRLDTRQTGGKPETFAREAKKIVVDIHRGELDKRRGLTPDVAICADAKRFLIAINKTLPKIEHTKTKDWLRQTSEWKVKYPTCLPEYYKQKGSVNSYVFAKTLSEELSPKSVIIPDSGGHLTWIMQALELKDGQTLFSAFGNSPMGYAFPAGIGAAFGVKGKRPVITITGDGSMQINIQELQTVAHYKLPLKIFIMNNHSYGIIKQFQDSLFNGRHEASSLKKGYGAPDFIKIGKAYDIKSVSIKNHKELRSKIKEVLQSKEAVLCDVLLDEDQKLIPKLEFGNPIENMSPLLSKEEFESNMQIKTLK